MEKTRPTIEDILVKTANHYGLNRGQMTQPRRGPLPISWPRMLAMAIAYEQPNTGKAVGKVFKRDHSAVVKAHQRVGDLCQNHPDLKEELTQLRQVVGGI